MNALNILQSLIHINAVDKNAFAQVLGSLRVLAESDEQVQLKILQTLMKFTSCDTFELQEQNVRQAISLCLKLGQAKQADIHHTAEAALKRVVDLLFENTPGLENGAVGHDDLGSEDDPASQRRRTSYMFLQDMCLLHNQKQSRWLKINFPISQSLTLDIIELILSTRSSKRLFESTPAFEKLLREQVYPLVQRNLESITQSNFQVLLRTIRLLTSIISRFHTMAVNECEVFLAALIRLLEAGDYPPWASVLALEAINELSSNPELLLFLYTSYDKSHSQSVIFGSLTHSLGRFIHQSMTGFTGLSMDGKSDLWNSRVRTRGLDMYNDSEIPDFPQTLPVSLAVKALMQTVDALQMLSCNLQSKNQIVVEPLIQKTVMQELCTEMVEVIWRPLLGAFQLLLSRSHGEEQLQKLVKTYQTLITTCGLLSLPKPLDEFLKNLCEVALPKEETELTKKNIQCFKAIFNIATGLGNFLGKSWNIVLTTLQHLDYILCRFSEHIHNMTHEEQNEHHTLTSTLERTFESTQHLTESALEDLVHALGALTLASLASAATLLDPSEDDSTSALLRTTTSIRDHKLEKIISRQFGLVNLVNTMTHNMHRIECIWKLAIDYFMSVINHVDSGIRMRGLTYLQKVIIAALNENPGAQSGDSAFAEEEVEEMSQEEIVVAPSKRSPDQRKNFRSSQFKARVMYPIYDLCRVRHDDIKEGMLDSLLEILQNSGQNIGPGWPVVFKLLYEVASNDPSPAAIKKSFDCVKTICQDFKECISSECLQQLIETIGCFGTQTKEPNISFRAISYLWEVSDFLSGAASKSYDDPDLRMGRPVVSETKANSLQLAVFQQLQILSNDARAEVRNSAVQSLFGAITSYGYYMRTETWLYCVDMIDVLLKELFTSGTRSKQSVRASGGTLGRDRLTGKEVKMMMHHRGVTSAQQWAETENLALQGSCRVFKMFFPKLISLEKFNQLWHTFTNIIVEGMTSHHNMVAITAINTFQEIIQSQQFYESNPPDRVKADIVQVYDRVCDKIVAESADGIAWETNGVFLESLTKLICVDSPSRDILENDFETFLLIADKLTTLMTPVNEAKRTNRYDFISNKRETPLQRKALDLYNAVGPLPEPLCVKLIEMHISYVLRAGKPGENQDLVKQRFPNTEIATCEFASMAMKNLGKIYSQEYVTDVCKIKTLDTIIQSIHGIFLQEDLPHKLVEFSANTFRDVCQGGLVAFQRVQSPDLSTSNTWRLMQKTVDSFLKKPAMASLLDPSRDLKLDMIDCIVDVLLPKCSTGPVEITEHFLDILKSGTKLSTSSRVESQSAQACLSGICRLCSPQTGEPHELAIAAGAVPVFIKVVSEILTKFLRDDHSAAMPEYRDAEFANALELILNLKVPSELELDPNKIEVYGAQGRIKADFSVVLETGRSSCYPHLLCMFPVFCDLVLVRKYEHRQLVQKCLRLYSEEVGLLQ